MDVLPQIEALLKQTMGLDANSIGSATIERAVEQRQAACRIRDPILYWDHLSGSPAELQELIETVVVPETWFFRDREAFAALANLVMPEWLRGQPLGPLRVLSVPCSSGEEPYSAAMALLDAGLSPNRFQIDAVDISARALALAQRGVYGSNSFRGEELSFRQRHFDALAEGHRIRDAVRQSVRFRQANLFAGALSDLYDVIFCRNLLIYFDRPMQDRAIRLLSGLLTAKGFLFVGPSETSLLANHEFSSARWPLSFCFRKAPPERKAPVAPPPRPRTVRPARVTPVVTRAAPRAAAPLPETQEQQLERAQRLADQGRLAEAQSTCEKCIREYGPTARAYYLLGLVRDAASDVSGAGDFYRKALYLDPEHEEALLHLALLLEQQGDRAGAQLLRSRAQRRARGAAP